MVGRLVNINPPVVDPIKQPNAKGMTACLLICLKERVALKKFDQNWIIPWIGIKYIGGSKADKKASIIKPPPIPAAAEIKEHNKLTAIIKMAVRLLISAGR